MKSAINVLFIIFLLICIGVHIVGLTTRFNDESVPSHIIHLISYCLCLFAFIRPIPYRVIIYWLAAIYPFYYHARCAWHSYSELGKLNPICILVIVLMPLIGVWLWQTSAAQPEK